MKRLLSRFFGGETRPVTHLTVAPAARDANAEAIIKHHRTRAAEVTMVANRTSWAIRRQLAENVLSIISGDQA
ncbi:hypothetical protein GB928_018835 [Shinella curvata]|uniref:Uncharacterized protein n=1 Tax=Shinella curvata TaxID=1817964 RepID=A0ABT8XHM7_9HYPH|nr:hypothetical protein [Shinella curvata]MCJ8053917.1 hypothetical protein [Shinella curvata]MDO6123249.1 hypothetical protein [Shinella curvata]